MLRSITKREAAKQQLTAAIRLLLDDENLIPVYSLATNAWEIIDALCKHQGFSGISDEARENVPAGKDLKRHYINEKGRNFFKHADNDPDATFGVLTYNQVDSVIFLAVEDYIRLFRQSPIEYQVFQLWYLTLYASKVSEEHWQRIEQAGGTHFPNLTALTRLNQLEFARDKVNKCYLDKEIVEATQTEA